MTAQLALFGSAMDLHVHRPEASDPSLLVLAEIGIKAPRYRDLGVPAVGFRTSQLDRLADRGWITLHRLDDPDVDEGPRRVRLTAAGRDQVERYDAWAENWGFTGMTDYVHRYVMGGAA